MKSILIRNIDTFSKINKKNFARSFKVISRSNCLLTLLISQKINHDEFNTFNKDMFENNNFLKDIENYKLLKKIIDSKSSEQIMKNEQVSELITNNHSFSLNYKISPYKYNLLNGFLFGIKHKSFLKPDLDFIEKILDESQVIDIINQDNFNFSIIIKSNSTIYDDIIVDLNVIERKMSYEDRKQLNLLKKNKKFEIKDKYNRENSKFSFSIKLSKKYGTNNLDRENLILSYKGYKKEVSNKEFKLNSIIIYNDSKFSNNEIFRSNEISKETMLSKYNFSGYKNNILIENSLKSLLEQIGFNSDTYKIIREFVSLIDYMRYWNWRNKITKVSAVFFQ